MDPENTETSRSTPVRLLQEQVALWIRSVGVRYFNELTNTAILAEEVGEVARIMARRYGEQSFKEGEEDVDLGEELSDVLFVVLCLAEQTGTDLQTAWDRKMQLRTDRDASRHSGNPELRRS